MAPSPQPPREEPAHDVLAAEAFAVPGPDPVLSHKQPLRLPEDPTGIPEAHDILAAEEFAMPAPGPRRSGPRVESPRRTGLIAAAAALLGAVLFRRRRGV